MNKPAKPQRYFKYRLREVHESHVLRLADLSFAVLSKERRGSIVHLDLEATDGSRATLIGVSGARVSGLGLRSSPFLSMPSGGGDHG